MRETEIKERREKEIRRGRGKGRRKYLNYIEKSPGMREGQPSPWAEKFRVGDRVCQVGTEGCKEDLETRSALICKICTSVPWTLESETKQWLFLSSSQ